MRKLYITGRPGAGKTTFSVELAKSLKLPLLSLDREFMRANWTTATPAEMDKYTQEVTAGDSWIIEGFYPSQNESVIKKSDGIIVLDIPPLTCFRNATARMLRYYGTNCPGTPEVHRQMITTGLPAYLLRTLPDHVNAAEFFDKAMETAATHRKKALRISSYEHMNALMEYAREKGPSALDELIIPKPKGIEQAK